VLNLSEYKSGNRLYPIKTFYAPIELQTQFAQIVEKTEALKTQYQQSLIELENLNGSLSQKAFKGELTIKRNETIEHQ
jgi:type I restriction enzyme S subunit